MEMGMDMGLGMDLDMDMRLWGMVDRSVIRDGGGWKW